MFCKNREWFLDGAGARCFFDRVLMQERSRRLVSEEHFSERIAGRERVTVAADKGYDTKEFVKEMRGMTVSPHVAQNTKRPGGSAIDARTTRHAAYRVSQQRRKIVEEAFGWMKTVGGQKKKKTKYRGLWRVGWIFTFAAAAYNLLRMRTLATLAVQVAMA